MGSRGRTVRPRNPSCRRPRRTGGTRSHSSRSSRWSPDRRYTWASSKRTATWRRSRDRRRLRSRVLDGPMSTSISIRPARSPEQRVARALAALPDRIVLLLFWTSITVSVPVMLNAFDPRIVVPLLAMVVAATWRLMPSRTPHSWPWVVSSLAILIGVLAWVLVHLPHASAYVVVTGDHHIGRRVWEVDEHPGQDPDQDCERRHDPRPGVRGSRRHQSPGGRDDHGQQGHDDPGIEGVEHDRDGHGDACPEQQKDDPVGQGREGARDPLLG